MDEDVQLGAVLKAAQSEQRFAYSVAYPADRVDGHEEFMRKAQVELTAWDFLANGRQIGFHHADGTVGHGTVVESGIHRGPSFVMKAMDGSEQTVNTGDWLLGVIFDAQTWPLVKSGRVNGWSIDGKARRSVVPRSEVES